MKDAELFYISWLSCLLPFWASLVERGFAWAARWVRTDPRVFWRVVQAAHAIQGRRLRGSSRVEAVIDKRRIDGEGSLRDP